MEKVQHEESRWNYYWTFVLTSFLLNENRSSRLSPTSPVAVSMNTLVPKSRKTTKLHYPCVHERDEYLRKSGVYLSLHGRATTINNKNNNGKFAFHALMN